MFKFRLQSVLNVRERMEKIKYKEYSEVMLEWQNFETEMETRREKMRTTGKNLDEARIRATTAMTFQLHDHFKQRLESELEQLGEQQREKQQEVDVKRTELVEARRAHKALDILKDKARKRYDLELKRREQIWMDEVASNHYAFHRNEESP